MNRYLRCIRSAGICLVAVGFSCVSVSIQAQHPDAVLVTDHVREATPDDFLRVTFVPAGVAVTTLARPGSLRAFATLNSSVRRHWNPHGRFAREPHLLGHDLIRDVFTLRFLFRISIQCSNIMLCLVTSIDEVGLLAYLWFHWGYLYMDISRVHVSRESIARPPRRAGRRPCAAAW